MKINNKEHYKQDWIVHHLISDFEVEDVWQFPVQLEKRHTIAIFQAQFFEALEQLSKKGLAGWLFKLRTFLGQLFGWDKALNQSTISVKKGSIRERYAQQFQLNPSTLIPVGAGEFEPVYVLENETLSEIKNKTVHAGLHLARVPFNGKYIVQMAVYVKPKGKLGKYYMALIKPFRLAIVYPAMMRLVGKHWQTYLEKEKK